MEKAKTELRIKSLFSGEGKVADFLNSVGFIWITAAVTLLFWAVKLDFEGVAVLFLMMTAVLFLCKDATCVITPFTFLFFVFSDSSMKLEGREFWIALLILPIAGFIYNIVRFRQKADVKGYSFSFLLCLIPWLLQGITRSGREITGGILCAALAIVFTLAYFAINACVRRDGEKPMEYLIHVLLALGVLISAQLLIRVIRANDFTFNDLAIGLGWGSRNPVAAILAMTIPAAFYFSTKEKKFSFLFIFWGLAQYVLTILLQSRGVTVFITAAMPILLIYALVKAKRKLPAFLSVAVIILAGVITLIFMRELLEKLFYRIIKEGFSLGGRSGLYEAGIECFSEYPLFGVGFDYRLPLYYEMISGSNGPVYYHCSILQIAACLGITGLIIYFYHYYWRFRVMLTDINSLKFTLLMAMLIVEAYSIFDNIVFQPMGYFIIMLMALCAERSLEKKQAEPYIFRIKPRRER